MWKYDNIFRILNKDIPLLLLMLIHKSVKIERISRKEGSGFLEREINRTGRKRILKI